MEMIVSRERWLSFVSGFSSLLLFLLFVLWMIWNVPLEEDQRGKNNIFQHRSHSSPCLTFLSSFFYYFSYYFSCSLLLCVLHSFLSFPTSPLLSMASLTLLLLIFSFFAPSSYPSSCVFSRSPLSPSPCLLVRRVPHIHFLLGDIVIIHLPTSRFQQFLSSFFYFLFSCIGWWWGGGLHLFFFFSRAKLQERRKCSRPHRTSAAPDRLRSPLGEGGAPGALPRVRLPL